MKKILFILSILINLYSYDINNTKSFEWEEAFKSELYGLAVGDTSIPKSMDFSKIDEHALNVPKEKTINIYILTRYLISVATNDWGKVRAIHRWITENIRYDTHSFFSGAIIGNRTAEQTLEARVAVCGGYANLFKAMCDKASLEVIKISGWAKGYSYLKRGLSKQTDHAWNAVKIKDKWYLFDVTWDSGYVTGRYFVKEFEDYWFATSPDEFIFTHLPENGKWQLLVNPITYEEYKVQPYIRGNFFKSGFLVSDVKRAIQNKVKYFPKMYNTKGKKASVVKAPVTYILPTQDSVTFHISCSDTDSIAVINGRDWHYLEDKTNGVFEGVITPRPGRLKVSIKGNDKRYWTFLEYYVK